MFEGLLALLEHLVELLGLGDVAREPVEDEPSQTRKGVFQLSRTLRSFVLLARERETDPSWHSLFSSNCDLIMPMTISSETSPPASMIFLASLPSSEPALTCSRSMSPVAKWHTLYFSLIQGACVPLPVGGEGGK